jgi:hypothetical protein
MIFYRISIDKVRLGTEGGRSFAPWRDAARPSYGVPFARTCKHSLFKTQLINLGRRNQPAPVIGKVQPSGYTPPSYPADAGCSSEFRDRCTTSAIRPYAYLAHASDLSDCAAPIGDAVIGVPLFTRPS